MGRESAFLPPGKSTCLILRWFGSSNRVPLGSVTFLSFLLFLCDSEVFTKCQAPFWTPRAQKGLKPKFLSPGLCGLPKASAEYSSFWPGKLFLSGRFSSKGLNVALQRSHSQVRGLCHFPTSPLAATLSCCNSSQSLK